MREIFRAGNTSNGGRLNAREAMTPSRWISKLTTSPLSPRLDRGVNFMGEGKNEATGSTFKNTSNGGRLIPSGVEGEAMTPSRWSSEQSRQVPQERINKAREAWRQNYLRRGIDIGDPKNSLPADERSAVEMAIREGIYPMSGGAESIPTAGITRPELINIVTQLNQQASDLEENDFNPEDLQSEIDRINEFIDKSTFLPGPDLDQANNLVRTLKQRKKTILDNLRNERDKEIREQRSERFGMYLQREDIERLNAAPQKWLDEQFDIIYRNVQQGQELTSPVFQNMQTVAGEAIRYLQYHNPSGYSLEEFQSQFNNRLNLIVMRSLIGRRGLEQIQGAAAALGAHGLFTGFGMEGRKVESMYNRLHELLEDERLKLPLNHVTNELAYGLQQRVIEEQKRLVDSQIGDFYNPGRTKEEAEADITRAVRTAYDVFVSSQRMAVIVARGRRLLGSDAYFSDPASGPLNVYNIEDLLISKFEVITAEGDEFLRRIKLDLAENHIKELKRNIPGLKEKLFNLLKISPSPSTKERVEIEAKIEYYEKMQELNEVQREELGRRLFRDFFAVPDFFSSGWRIKAVLESIEERLKKRYGEEDGTRRAKDLALFMRLKTSDEEWAGYDKSKRKVWERITELRPDEIVRLYRERALKADSGGDKELAEKLNQLFEKDAFRNAGVHSYDEFKEEFGPILRLLRDKGYKEEFKQLDIVGEGFNDAERDIITKYFNNAAKAGELKAMFEAMSEFGKNSINDLLYNEKFADIYTRTITIDDALLGELENEDGIDQDGHTVKKIFTPLSKKYGDHPGADALPRMWNDTADAVAASQSLISFVNSTEAEEKMKAAVEFASKTTYNGMGQRAKSIRFTIGTFLNLSKKDYFWDVTKLEKLPFRLPMSDIERIMGPHAKPIGREELRQQIDKIRDLLLASAGKDQPGDENLPPNILNFEREKRKRSAYKILNDLEKTLEITTFDLVKRRIFSLLLFFMLAVLLGGTTQVAKKSIDLKAA